MRILIVEDETSIANFLTDGLTEEGFSVDVAENGKLGLKMALGSSNAYDIILLDWMLPGLNGIEICRAIRQKNTSVPIIFLTAKNDEKTEVRGLNLGADDFLTKPISTAKLVSRITAVLRRLDSLNVDNSDQLSANENLLKVHDLVIDRERFIVLKEETELQLPKKEFELLFYLANRKGKVLDRQTLLNEVWGSNIYVIDRTIDVHIRKIREKLGDDYIETVKGVGYRFKE